MAAMIYGEPRATLDIDIVLAADPTSTDRILAAFDPSRYHLPPREVIAQELSREENGSFQILDKDTGLKADIFIAGSDPLSDLGFSQPVLIELSGHRIQVASATYVVAIKLQFYSISQQAKHLNDIVGILRFSRPQVDLATVDAYARKYGVVAEWEQCCVDAGDDG